jgi:hypothetical protein
MEPDFSLGGKIAKDSWPVFFFFLFKMNELKYFLSQDIELKLRLRVLRCELPWAPTSHPPEPFTSLLLSRPLVGADPRCDRIGSPHALLSPPATFFFFFF